MNPFNIALEIYFSGLAVYLIFLAARSEGEADLSWLQSAAWLGALIGFAGLNTRGALFGGTYVLDGLSQFFKLAVSLGFAIAVSNMSLSKSLEKNRADYFMLLAFSALGLTLISSCVELVSIYVALELSSYAVYALVPLRASEKRAAEAGIKYILFGAMATAVSLFGLSYVIAGAHTTYLAEMAGISFSMADAPMAAVGLTLFLAGFFYKLALFPFHFWCPDVYDGASNETAAYVATLPKLGAVVVLARLGSLLTPGLEITTILAALGAASMTFGNLAALAQTDVKRLLGYSSVAHAGYVMLGLVSGTPEGLGAASFYALIYILMNLAAFFVLCRVSVNGENVSLDDLNGLSTRAPGLAFILATAAFALVGLPPTAGFSGKLFLLTSAWDHGYNWLVIVAVLNTAISIYFYLNMVRHAYTLPVQEGSGGLAIPGSAKLLGGLLSAALLWLGVMPGSLFELTRQAGKLLLP